MTDNNIMERLHALNSKIMGAPPPEPQPAAAKHQTPQAAAAKHQTPQAAAAKHPTMDIPKPTGAIEQAVSKIERQPAASISLLIVGELHDANIINDWELEFLLSTSGQEPCFAPLQPDDWKLPPLTYGQTVKRVIISLKILRHFDRITSEHYGYLDKLYAAD